MSNYFSDFFGRFGGAAIGLSTHDQPYNENLSPTINFATLFNPTWATIDDDSFEVLAHQIIFLVTPNSLRYENNAYNHSKSYKESFLRKQLNIIGLIRGSCSLLSDFGSRNRSTTIEINDGAIIVIRLENDYFIALSMVCGTEDRQSINSCVQQVIQLVQNRHRMFELINSSFLHVLRTNGKIKFRELVKSHWACFIEEFNLSGFSSIGSSNILWPCKLNYRGVFGLLPHNAYYRLSMRSNSNLSNIIDNIVSNVAVKPAGYIVAILSQYSTKNSGIIHMNLGNENKLEKTAIIDLYNLFETANANLKLTPSVVSGVRKVDRNYGSFQYGSTTESVRTQVQSLNDEEATKEQLSNVKSSFTILHPQKLTKKLFLKPLNDTVSGLKNLGSTVTGSMNEVPSWLSKLNYFGIKVPRPESTITDAENADTHENGYLTGLVEDQVIGILAHIITTNDRNIKSIEYQIFVYKQSDTLIMLLFESGLEILSNLSFYASLEKDLFCPISEALEADVLIESSPVSISINSLPDPIQSAFYGEHADKRLEIDEDFFFIICDTLKQSYQTSLPDLQTRKFSGIKSFEENISHRVINYLHDHLISHFLFETRGQLFDSDGSTLEQLHKFSSSKGKSWLFYSLRHKQKVIIIIRKSNNKAKTMVHPTIQGNYLMQVADSVYGAANLGFLEILGGDVRIWLAGIDKRLDAA